MFSAVINHSPSPPATQHTVGEELVYFRVWLWLFISFTLYCHVCLCEPDPNTISIRWDSLYWSQSGKCSRCSSIQLNKALGIITHWKSRKKAALERERNDKWKHAWRANVLLTQYRAGIIYIKGLGYSMTCQCEMYSVNVISPVIQRESMERWVLFQPEEICFPQ